MLVCDTCGFWTKILFYENPFELSYFFTAEGTAYRSKVIIKSKKKVKEKTPPG